MFTIRYCGIVLVVLVVFVDVSGAQLRLAGMGGFRGKGDRARM